jgi:hypothetical protein
MNCNHRAFFVSLEILSYVQNLSLINWLICIIDSLLSSCMLEFIQFGHLDIYGFSNFKRSQFMSTSIHIVVVRK